VAETVVYLLEAVEIDQQDGEQPVGALGAGKSLVEPVTKRARFARPVRLSWKA